MRFEDATKTINAEFGANASYVEDLLRQYQINPRSVGDEWEQYFSELFNGHTTSPISNQSAVAATATAAAPAPAPIVQPAPIAPSAPISPITNEQAERQPIRGVALKIVENMDASLAVPTATSVRQIQIKLLDENRRFVNRAQGRGKISYTHFIAWAMVKALAKYPQMNDGFELLDGVAHRVKNADVNLGLAVDVQKKDGTRSLLVPNVKAAHKMNFLEFYQAYQRIVSAARDNKLTVEDFKGTTISLTNPGTLGTSASSPRLMAGQGAIIATGSIDYPPEYSAMTDAALSQLGISKVMTLTSTYDHRIIQGAESGSFLAYLHELLMGQHNFYDEIFADLGIAYKPLRWSKDFNPILSGVDREREMVKKQMRVFEFINAYRVRGHLIADIDPLNMISMHEHPELEAETYGLSIWDLDRTFFTSGLGGVEETTFREIWGMLIQYYCSTVGIESRHIISKEQKQWIINAVERAPEPLSPQEKKHLLKWLIAAEQFEKFLHTKFLGQKRFSLEGCETTLPMLEQIIHGAAERGIDEIVLGMAHRGRLTILANLIGNHSERLFTIFEGSVHPNFPADSGDVKYHQGAMAEREIGDKKVKLTLAPNPSHLEAVNPVVEGLARAKQDARRPALSLEDARGSVLPVLLHGDAAFIGQGVVMETLNLADLKGYRTGGTIHLVINNQIGFTTSPEASRSSVYSSDVAKMTQLPIFHVNCDDVEAALRTIEIALDWRQKFRKDIVIDLIGFRRHGHNEGDEPSYTQPLMYQRVKEHPGVRELYARQLIREGVITAEELQQMIDERWRRYENALLGAKEIVAATKERITVLPEPPTEDDGSFILETAVSSETIAQVAQTLSVIPNEFSLNPKMVTQMSRRAKMGSGETPIDWGFGESLAFGSLLLEGATVRLSGEDVGRGTFSQRHAIMYDTRTGQPWTPLEQLANNGTRFEVFDSSLSEFGVLGFEYGYSVEARDALVMWEAQFGDFANGAQVIIDQFIAPGEDKWKQTCRLVMLLPHGYEGQGPEHSSARLERYLQLCAENNMQVCYPTTPAQYFHLLRRQVRQDVLRPLVVMTPKSLLRLPQAVSSLDEFTSGGFQPVIGDSVHPDNVQRVLICSGKVYYDLHAEREKRNEDRLAILRLEQFYPFPETRLRDWLLKYNKASEIFWVQEEPRNMGGWWFMRSRLEALTRAVQELRYVGRVVSASPATGSYTLHGLEQQQFIQEALGR
jgi:2-oxoglutarate dehydrogenase E1 component